MHYATPYTIFQYHAHYYLITIYILIYLCSEIGSNGHIILSFKSNNNNTLCYCYII